MLSASGTALEVVVARSAAVDKVLRAATPRRGSLYAIGDYDKTVCWHDTEDLLLTRAGLTLRSAEEDDETVWTLTEHKTSTQHFAPTEALSHLAGDLPDGRLRWIIDDVVGLKPLVVQLEARVTTALYRALDELDKTIAIVTVEHAAGTGGSRWSSVRLQAMRGFDSDLRPLIRRLDKLEAVAVLDRPVLKAVGRAVAPKRRSKTKLHPTLSARDGFITAMRPIAEDIQSLLAPTIADLDPEFLHDLRVNVRRTRSGLRIADGALREDEIRIFSAGFAWLGEVSGPQRELDVYIQSLPGLAKKLGPKDQDWLKPFYDLLVAEREREHVALQLALRSPRLDHLLATWERLLAEKRDSSQAVTPMLRIDSFADQRLTEVLGEMLLSGDLITTDSASEELHDLRKTGKRMRYTLDLFSSLFPARQLMALTAQLKSLQEFLGEFQDVCDQRDGLVRFAHAVRADDGPTTTILAMGQLAAVLSQRLSAMREEFEDRYTAFRAAALTSRFAPTRGVIS